MFTPLWLLVVQSVKFGQVPISYYPRSVEEGKKIRLRDAFIALWTVLRYRVKPFAQCVQTEK